MQIRINCQWNDSGVWCTNKNVKRSLLGFGARCCMEVDGKDCSYKVKNPRPPAPTGQGVKSPTQVVLLIANEKKNL